MKKTFLNVLVVSCLMSSVPVKADRDTEGAVALVFGGTAVGAATLVGVATGASAILATRRWGSKAIGVPAVAFGVPFTPENKALLEAAKNKNNAFLRKKLIELDKNLGIRAIHPILLLELEVSKLEKEISKLYHKAEVSPRPARDSYLNKMWVLQDRQRLLNLKIQKHKVKYRAQFKKWETLRRLYAAIDAIYYGKGQYQRLAGLRKMRDYEFIAIKEKLDKQLGISDQ